MIKKEAGQCPAFSVGFRLAAAGSKRVFGRELESVELALQAVFQPALGGEVFDAEGQRRNRAVEQVDLAAPARFVDLLRLG